ncbi:hypothetical protein BKE38_10595 [Pseudoroseomonas deserti]|uniref:ABC3 transporter permease C-terminal domain-containing protein n=1 Tax=Teichococcus deserti TaxID=1817963 RepID=A0A1V2H2Y1_9PROT|nr:ABC transporter permease [Pseudoroseomonas deserti]ONG54280.1 hypothetical protein BKE38_10595 [Pseudoroseomonas deserti]
MNPWPIARAALRRRRGTVLALMLLVALATALGIGVGLMERGLRRGAAQAADGFDLLVGAPGSQTQLTLTAIYLQPDVVPLLPGAVLQRLQADTDVAWLSPIGFGDRWGSHPVVGVAPAFLTLGGRRPLAEGRAFAAEGEAVVGHAVPLKLGERGVPQHGLAHAHAEPHGHEHEEAGFTVVGRMPPTGTPWDWAVLLPIETVWEVHGLGNGHASEEAPLGPPWTVDPPGVPAVMVAPRGIAQAYQLRQRYRSDGAMAFFPAEVLVSLFRIGGDLRMVLSGMAAASTGLVLAAVFLSFAGLLAVRRQEFAVLRAIGAPRRFLLAAVWLEMAVILGVGAAAGFLLGWLGAALTAGTLGRAARVSITIAPSLAEAGLAAAILAAGLLAALLPALWAWRRPPAEGLQG